MSQVPVKYVDPDCLFQTKGLNTTVIPVIELLALREVVEGLKEINSHAQTQYVTKAIIAVIAQRLLASLGEVGT